MSRKRKGRPPLGKRAMTSAERQRKHRSLHPRGPEPPRPTFKQVAQSPQRFAQRFYRRHGYLATLDLRDALDKAMDRALDADGDAVPTAYLIRNNVGR